MNETSSFSSAAPGEPFATARFIKEIGRGKKGARSLSREDARVLYQAMLAGRVSDLEVGAIVLALRIKGESVDEIAGFLDAAESMTPLLPAPAGRFAPIILPSYNGSRASPNLTPLLAMLLARAGAPVLIHGVMRDPGRVTTAEILHEMGIAPTYSAQEAVASWQSGQPVFMPISAVSPRLAEMLALRQTLGVRNSAHTLVKILQPFDAPALRLTSYTHPEYLDMLSSYFSGVAPRERGHAFLMRGTEGETVANARRANQITWFHDGERTVLVERAVPMDELPALPDGSDAVTTARWIMQALDGRQPVPAPIQDQARHCLRLASLLREASTVPAQRHGAPE